MLLGPNTTLSLYIPQISNSFLVSVTTLLSVCLIYLYYVHIVYFFVISAMDHSLESLEFVHEILGVLEAKTW